MEKLSRDGREEWAPFDLSPYCSTSSFDAASAILQEMFAALQSLDITLEQVCSEYHPSICYLKHI